jgi:hypothetical protein
MCVRTEGGWAEEIGWEGVGVGVVRIVMDRCVVWKSGSWMGSWATGSFLVVNFLCHVCCDNFTDFDNYSGESPRQLHYYQLCWKCFLFLVMTGHINVVLVLQSCTDCVQVMAGLSAETFPTYEWSIKHRPLYFNYFSLNNTFPYKMSYLPSFLQIIHILIPSTPDTINATHSTSLIL